MRPSPIPPSPDISFWWEPLELGSLTDLLSIALTLVILCLTGIVAFRQIRIMRKQSELMKEQNATTQRMETLTTDIHALTIRQGEIAETQHTLVHDQLARKSHLSVVLTYEGPHNGCPEFSIAIRNTGTKAVALGCYWHIYLHRFYGLQWSIGITVPHSSVRAPVDGEEHECVKGFVQEPIFVNRLFHLGYIRGHAHVEPPPLTVRWFLVCEDGRFPEVEGAFGTTTNELPSAE